MYSFFFFSMARGNFEKVTIISPQNAHTKTRQTQTEEVCGRNIFYLYQTSLSMWYCIDSCLTNRQHKSHPDGWYHLYNITWVSPEKYYLFLYFVKSFHWLNASFFFFFYINYFNMHQEEKLNTIMQFFISQNNNDNCRHGQKKINKKNEIRKVQRPLLWGEILWLISDTKIWQIVQWELRALR